MEFERTYAHHEQGDPWKFVNGVENLVLQALNFH
jgi:hypothetical protein